MDSARSVVQWFRRRYWHIPTVLAHHSSFIVHHLFVCTYPAWSCRHPHLPISTTIARPQMPTPMSRLVWLFSLKSHTQPGVDEAASNHSSHKGGNNSLHVRSLLPYLLTNIIPQMSRLTRSNKGFTAHLHSPALALGASALQVCAAAQRRCQGEHAARPACTWRRHPGPLAPAGGPTDAKRIYDRDCSGLPSVNVRT